VCLHYFLPFSFSFSSYIKFSHFLPFVIVALYVFCSRFSSFFFRHLQPRDTTAGIARARCAPQQATRQRSHEALRDKEHLYFHALRALLIVGRMAWCGGGDSSLPMLGLLMIFHYFR